MYNVENALRKLGLNKNQIKILDFLLSNVSMEFTAKEMSRNVNLPLSRCYAVLNQLYVLNLIEKRHGKLIKFYITDPEIRFMKFMKLKDYEVKEIQKNIIDMISKFTISGKSVEILESPDEVYKNFYLIASRANSIKAFAKTPVLLIPEEQKGFWRSQLFKLYKEKIVSGIDFYYIIDSVILKRKINKRNIKDVKNNLEWILKYKNVHLKDLKGREMVSMMITDKECILIFHNVPGSLTTEGGLLIKSKEIVNFFDSLYNDIFNNSKDVTKNIKF